MIKKLLIMKLYSGLISFLFTVPLIHREKFFRGITFGDQFNISPAKNSKFYNQLESCKKRRSTFFSFLDKFLLSEIKMSLNIF